MGVGGLPGDAEAEPGTVDVGRITALEHRFAFGFGDPRALGEADNHTIPTVNTTVMRFEIPEDCRYMETHEWARRDGDSVHIGITDFAQDELGDIVFIELPAVGETVEAGTEFGVVESIKAVSDLYAPVSGEVVAVNDDLADAPELVNDDPFGDGWMLEVEPTEEAEFDDLISPDEYEAQTQ